MFYSSKKKKVLIFYNCCSRKPIKWNAVISLFLGKDLFHFLYQVCYRLTFKQCRVTQCISVFFKNLLEPRNILWVAGIIILSEDSLCWREIDCTSALDWNHTHSVPYLLSDLRWVTSPLQPISSSVKGGW